MAIVNLKDVTVSRLNSKGFGFGVKEENESNGKTYTTYWTVWAKEAHNLSVGDVISVSGFLSAKVGEPRTGNDNVERVYVELSINGPRIQGSQPTSSPQEPRQTEPDPWATSSVNDSSTPF